MDSFFLILFCIFCVLQLLLPYLAGKVESRFQKIGYNMKSQPMFAIFDSSKFWSEARKTNRKYKDPVIKKYLAIHLGFWIGALVSFAGVCSTLN